jgi:sRNA-binding regulator protein Hfq
MAFLTGRQSKLAKLLEAAIREQLVVEVELANGEVLYGTVHGYEFSAHQFIVTVETPKNMVVVNFHYVVKMRVQHKTSLNVAPQSTQ